MEEREEKRGRERIKLKVKHDVFHLGRCSWGSDCRFLHESPDGGTRGIEHFRLTNSTA